MPLAEFFREIANKELECRVDGFSTEAQKKLLTHTWPGNVRELKHNAERFVLGLLTHHQPVPMTQQEESGLTACIDAFEKKLIEDMLRQTEGQVSLTARLLQLPRKTLYDKLNKHQIQPQVYLPESSS